MSVVSLLNSCSSTTCALWKLKNPLTSWKELRPSSRNGVRLGNYHSTNWINKNGFKVKAFFNPTDDPIIKQALKGTDVGGGAKEAQTTAGGCLSRISAAAVAHQSQQQQLIVNLSSGGSTMGFGGWVLRRYISL
ncbi:uncharacterized protein LOC115965514 isoform X3 [Quercus lobata]|uniref:uncharacterized protein LOC115965514 isoform X3 n=1 Tax=Quercus lobata TaxID=97700 RepID=UPI00124609AA|nr:uncharacterized protein LOC115965514 isoform X3 [Quercus lobata]